MNVLKQHIFAVLICIACVTTFCIPSPGGHAFPEQLGESVFNLIKSNQIDKIDYYIPAKNEYIKAIKDVSLNQDRKQHNINNIEDRFKEIPSDVRRGFTNIRQGAAQKGINWNNTKITRIYLEMKKREHGLEADINVFFSHAGSEYYFDLYDCIKVDRGWVITDRIEWRGKTFNKIPDFITKEPYVGKENKINEFGKTLFDLLKNNNKTNLSRYHMTKKEMTAYLRQTEMNEGHRKQALAQIDQHLNKSPT